MKVPVEVWRRCISEGGLIEADSRGGIWWLKGTVMAAWGNLAHMAKQ
jgi:hypothetical protein